MTIIDTLNTRRIQFDKTDNAEFSAAIDEVAAIIEERDRLRRALRQPTTETFSQDVAEYEASLAAKS